MENKINNFIKTNNLRLLNNLTELDDIKVVLIDAYGVFWDGSKIIEKTVSDMKNLIQKDIMVVVISNTTQISSKAIESYKKRGMYLGEHFNYFITSGELFKHYVEAGNIKNLIFLYCHINMVVVKNVLWWKVSFMSVVGFSLARQVVKLLSCEICVQNHTSSF